MNVEKEPKRLKKALNKDKVIGGNQLTIRIIEYQPFVNTRGIRIEVDGYFFECDLDFLKRMYDLSLSRAPHLLREYPVVEMGRT